MDDAPRALTPVRRHPGRRSAARSGVGGGGSPTGALDTGVRPGALAALRVPAYRAWFASQVLSASGLITQSVALSWLILQTTGNALWLAALTSCSLLPVLFGSAHGGALVDRHDTRRVLLVTQARS